MSHDLMAFFSGDSVDSDSRLPKEKIRALSYGMKKRTGERFARATMEDGRTFIRTLSKAGVGEKREIQIPAYSSKEERDDIVMDLLESYVQDDVADFMDLSQGTISNIKNKRRRK